MTYDRAFSYYKRAAEQGDKRAAQRLRSSAKGPHVMDAPGNVLQRQMSGIGEGEEDGGGGGGKGGKDKDCVVM